MKHLPTIVLFIVSLHVFGQKGGSSNDTIPLFLNEQNTIFIKAVFHEHDTLNLNFDTGTTELVLTNATLNNKLSFEPRLYSTPYDLKIGQTVHKTKLYDAALSGHGTDGRFGWDLFKGKILELDPEKGHMIVHKSLPKHLKKFSKLPIEFWKDLFFVRAVLDQSGVKNSDLFLFDTGYQRTLMLDNDLLLQHSFPTEKMETIKKVIMKGAQGNEIPVITANLETFKLGKTSLKNVPIQLMTINKPLKDKNTHILGNEVLKRFNIIFDFQNSFVYIKPNSLFSDSYKDQKKQ
jgi:hypothetical protein